MLHLLRQHVILVGLPGSGKSTVGSLVADMMGVRVFDVDSAVANRTGTSIAEIFERQGEAAFREFERTETLNSLLEEPGVIVPGGGWAAQPDNLTSVKGRAITVYLRTSPQEAARRVAPEGGRPLLETSDPVGAMESLLRERAGFYEECDARVDTDGKRPEEVAREVAELALQRAPG